MPRPNRSNPLALAVLISLYERPMHPYEIASTLRQRHKHESVRLNYGSLYSVVASLEKRGLITPRSTAREGRLPERTVYDLSDSGRIEMHDWLADLVATPVKDYPAFEAALCFLPALPPDEAIDLLEERATHLELEIVHGASAREFTEKLELPRLFTLEGEFRLELRRTELEFVRKLIREIRSGTLDGAAWWRAAYDNPDAALTLPTSTGGAVTFEARQS